MSVITLHYDVPGDDFTRAGEASGDVKAHLKKLGFSPEVIRNTVIALYEGEINMVIHAGGGKANKGQNEFLHIGAVSIYFPQIYIFSGNREYPACIKTTRLLI